MAFSSSLLPLLLPSIRLPRQSGSITNPWFCNATCHSSPKDDGNSDDTKKSPPKSLRTARDLPVLYDDGYGTKSMKDYLDAATEIMKPDGGPPRWFCPAECREPIEGAPVLLYLPDIDGVGMGLILHHVALGKVFEVRCLHIPINDQIPFEGLVKLVEQSVKHEHAICPSKPIYLVGDSFGGCIALAIAARNPSINLKIILVNPATCFGRSQLQPGFSAYLEDFLSGPFISISHLLGLIKDDPSKVAIARILENLPSLRRLTELSRGQISTADHLSDPADIITQEALLWKLKILNFAACYVNSRLQTVEADVLVLASEKDSKLQNGVEAGRLWSSLKNCRVRHFKDSTHSLLLEDGINLLSIIKGTSMYTRSRKPDFGADQLPLSSTEFKKLFVEDLRYRFFHLAISPVWFSTLKNGTIVRSLAGVPNEGPVLLVGNHMLMGHEVFCIAEELLRQKKIRGYGMAHPLLFSEKFEHPCREISSIEHLIMIGAVPVSGHNLYNLLSRKSFVLLYPGGIREALHRKGEEYKLFWPDQPEFVRIAARFEGTIVPFGVIGEDDVAEVVFDYNDLMSIPFMRELTESLNEGIRLRIDAKGEVSSQDFHFPLIMPKLPGRFYFLFGKPIETRGMSDILKDRKRANEMYLQVKSEVENLLSYLQRKRKEDPYRSILQRAMYHISHGFTDEVPSFEP